MEGYALRPDAQAFDEVRIFTVPRFKMSGLSGSEWRISATLQLMRKGRVLYEETFKDVETAVGFAYAAWHKAVGEGNAYFASQYGACDQEGCSAKATVTYRRIKQFSTENPYEWNGPATQDSLLRQFCDAHARRGDASFDDSDKNYDRKVEPADIGKQRE